MSPRTAAACRLGFGALVAALLARALPAGLGDGLRQTLVLVPLAASALAQLAATGRRLGGRRVPRNTEGGQMAAAGALVLIAFRLPEAGLALAEPVVIAGLYLVLLWRIASQLVAARPLLGRQLRLRPSALFFWLPLVAYVFLIPWATDQRQPDGDEPFYLLIAHSLAYDFDADLTNNYAAQDWRRFMDRPIEPQPGDPRGPDGQIYSRHNELLPMALAPAYRIGGKLGALLTMAVLTAMLAWLSLRLASQYFPERPGPALLSYGLVAFTPPLLLYSTQVWAEIPAALLSLLALDQILRLGAQTDRAAEAGPGLAQGWSWKRWLGIGVPVLLLPLLKIRFMLLAAPLLFLAWWYARRPWRPVLLLGLALALLGGGILAFNTLHFGNPLKIHSVEELALHQRTWFDYLEGGLGFFFDTAFGLFPVAPVWLLILPALISLYRRHRFLLRDLVIVATPYLLVVAPRGEWYGGWSPPFRYGLFTLPLLGLALIPLLGDRRRPGARALLTGLALLTVLATLVWLAVPGWTYNFADGRTYLLDHLSRQVGADAARFLPSSVRPRWATFLWPPILAALVLLFWWWPGRGVASRLRSAAAAGAAVVLTLLAILPVAATRLPTKVVEMEDPWVRKDRGHPFPERWVIERTRYRGGWVLRPGEALEIPVRPGGKQVRIRLVARFIRNNDQPVRLVLEAGGRFLAYWQPEEEDLWLEPLLGPFPWTEGESLRISVERSSGPPPKPPNGFHLDCAVLSWSDGR